MATKEELETPAEAVVGEIVEGTSNEVDIYKDPQAAVAALIRGAALEYADPQAISESIAARILTAETMEEAFAETVTVSAKDSVGRVFVAHDLRVFRSRFNGGEGGFVAVDVTDAETGEKLILTTSATKIGAKLIWLKMNEALPREVRIKELEGETAAGFKVLDIEAL